MIIATKDINYTTLKTIKADELIVLNYIKSLIPNYAKHIPHIMDNQRYYVAMIVRSMQTIPFKQRKELIAILTNGIRIYGIVSAFISVPEILSCCDKEDLCAMLQEELKYDIN